MSTPIANDFIRNRVREDVENEIVKGSVVTRFPPEPNGYLHIGHAKSICLNFGIAEEFGGVTYLRFDDTNPTKENDEFVASIQEDVRWLGFDWGDRLTFASDYFDQLFEFAVQLVRDGKAFVCDLSSDEIRASRGTLTKPGANSPNRDRSIDENIDLLGRMKAGEFSEGEKTLRLKIDMRSPNMNLRDPVIYRILHTEHHRTGDSWCIYPMYDFTHCICDSLEGITHSLCTLEFEDNRPLYDWVLDNIAMNVHPPQIEFSRLNLEYTVMSKRILTDLVTQGSVSGWDDPRLPTISGLRRRGIPAEAIRDFCSRIGVTKQANLVEVSLLNFCTRQVFETSVARGFAVLDPLPIEVTNFSGEEVGLNASYHPKVDLGSREVSFGRNLYIERSDFEEEAAPKRRKLTLNGMARLRYGFIIQCNAVDRDEHGNAIKLYVEYFPDSRSGQDTSGLKPKAVIHWLSAANAEACEFRIYDHLFINPEPDIEDLTESLNEDSLKVHQGLVERAVIKDEIHQLQFERIGYFSEDKESTADKPVFNQTVALVDRQKPKQP